MANIINKNIQTDKYVGIPYLVNGRDFSGIDCYGLVRLVYKEELGIDLPSFVEEGINPDRTQELIAQYKEGWEPTDTIEAGDVIVFKVMGVDAHIAVAVSSTHFLHARQGYDSAIESFESGRWKTRLVGAYKYSPNKSELLALPAANSVVLNGIPHPLRTERITTAIPAGTNVVQLEQWILKEYKIDDKLHPYVKVLVNGVPIPDAMKESTIIQENDCVEYRVLAQGGGDILRTVLTVAVIAAVAYATGGTALGGLGWGSSFGIVGTTVTGLALTAVGMALVDAIAPVRPPSASAGGVDPGSANAQLMVTGGANRATPYNSIPFVLGKVRVTPPLGANSYYFFNDQGTESYLRMLLVWGYGPLYVDESTLKIGELSINKVGTYSVVSNICTVTCANHGLVGGSTFIQTTSGLMPTAVRPVFTVTANTFQFPVIPNVADTSGNCLVYVNYEGIEQETLNRIAEPTAPELSKFNGLYGTDKTQVTANVEITADGVAGTAVVGPWLTYSSTDGAASDFTIAVHFPQGCRKIQSKGEGAGSSSASPVNLEIEYKKASAGTWSNAGVYTVGTTAVKDAFTWTKKVQYESDENLQVRIRRLTGTGNTAPADPDYQWLFTSQLLNTTFSRNAQPAVDPVNCKITKTALEIKASDQLNGQIEGINAIVWSYGKDWNGSAWVDGNINNPASLFRYVLEHPANPRRVTDVANKINLTQLQHWHEYCTTKGFTFNSVVGAQRSVLDILRDICAAGRASPAMVDGKWTVIIDEPKANVVQHFSPHNSWGFEGTKSLPRIPDGLRVSFINENKGYQEDEVIVYATASSQSNAALLESISVPGVTIAAKAIDHARWHMAQAKLRPETYTLNTDIEYIVCNRGDRVKVMHDVAMWGLGSGRIKNRLAGNLFELTEDVPVTNASYNFRFRSKSGTSTTANLIRVLTCTTAVRTSNVVTIALDGTGHPLSVGDTVTVAVSNASYNTSAALVSAVSANTFSYALAGANITSAAVTGTTTLNDDNYSKVKIDTTLADTLVDNDDLYLYGTVNTESQDLVVLSIEPMSNKAARLILVDYGVTSSADIFTDYLNYTNTLAFESNISLPPVMLIQSFGTKIPTITGIISDERVMERIASGVFAYKMQVSYSNATNLPATTTGVEFQWDFQSAVDYYGTRSKQVSYNLGSVLITGVEEGEALKVRARYVGSDGRTGQWTDWQNHTIVGKTNPPSEVTGLTISPDVTTGKLSLKWNQNLEVDLKSYEVRTDTMWGNAVNLVFLGDATSCLSAPAAVGNSVTFYIKAIDYSNNYSTIAGSASYTTGVLPNVATVVHNFYDTSNTSATVTIDWVDVAPTFGLKGYEITYDANTKVINGSFLTVPADWLGIRSFVIKTIDLNGQESTGTTYNVTKLVPNVPSTSTFGVNQGVLVLDWPDAVKTTLPVWGYEVRNDLSFGTSGYIFKGAASTCSVPNSDIALGTNNYYIKSIDTANVYSATYLTATYNKLAPSNVLSATHSFYDTSTTSATVTLNWPEVVPIFSLNYYEITYGGIVKTTKSGTITLPADWVGVRSFVIKVVDLIGNKSTGLTYNVTKLVPNAPITSTFSIDQATVLLDWSDAVKTTLPIWGYEVRSDLAFGTSDYIFKGAASNCRITGINLGVNTFYIKSIDTDSVYSSAYLTASFTVVAPPDITSVTHVFTDTSLTAATVTLDWPQVVPQFKLAQYEIAYDSVVKYVTANTITLPANWLGERTFTIKSVDDLGNKSAGFAKVVNKLAPNPVTNFRAQVIDNTVMFYWDLPTKTSLPIDHVLLKKGTVGSTWATASIIGPKSGGFTTQNETAGGNYVYYVAAVDTDGNESTPVDITTSVSQPPDFIFFATYTGTLADTKSSAVTEVNSTSLIMPVNTTQTFQDHFISNSWTTPQAQITAGYPLYIQPSNGTGYYEETFDYGTLLASSKVTLVINGVTLAGAVAIVPTISVSANGSTWADSPGTYEVFANSFRYVKVRITATASTGAGIYSLNSLNVSLESKLLNDAGHVSCLSTDALGTVVNFNKEFVDVTSITVSPAGTTAIIPVYDFVDSVAVCTYSITSNVCTVTSTAHGLITGQKIRLSIISGTAPSAVYTITGYTANTFTCDITTANTSGSVSTYPESFRLYLFNTAGARVSATASWALKGY